MFLEICPLARNAAARLGAPIDAGLVEVTHCHCYELPGEDGAAFVEIADPPFARIRSTLLQNPGERPSRPGADPASPQGVPQ
jgi:hypothetical protein